MSFQGIDPFLLALFIGGMSLVPLLLIICSAFLKIAIVLTIARNAIGVQQVPPNMALYAIALAATLFIMAPVGHNVAEALQERPLDFSHTEALQASALNAIKPLQAFMARNTNPDILTHLLENTQRMWPRERAEAASRDDLMLLIPAFMLSELEAGFQMGFLIYIPFIVIDLIVSNLLLALGMQMVAPMTISLPLKLLIFVLAQGWTQLLDSLFYSYL
ncbi:type III secretion system export apparatus subunit SctR [Pseudomonas sp. S75]|uniref:type III secretion system export apparatus subunit SctR n=1 Tax=unclassified Pseudomonas TaxID=196821 RepID=UPI001907EED1|nr:MULTISPECIES: type III secretion system export apparatus subunit SctR [unclassified Pseudomonas]MBJ9977912.1 type III secretion system export apparatus subunit SctR [Pseudomonas sp. S30]MBK0155882.1 type III secretion system export apparatus subunit SctR [Pseudomonas sp. S75]